MPNCVPRFLTWLQDELLVYSKDLSSYNLPLPVALAPITNTEAFLARERLAFNCLEETEKVKTRLPLLNTNQRDFFNAVVAALNDSNSKRLFCLDAPGGTGKTFVLNCLMNAVRGDGCIVVATALSAVASMLLEGGPNIPQKFYCSPQLELCLHQSEIMFTSALSQPPARVSTFFTQPQPVSHSPDLK